MLWKNKFNNDVNRNKEYHLNSNIQVPQHEKNKHISILQAIETHDGLIKYE